MKSNTLGELVFDEEEAVFKSSPTSVPVMPHDQCVFVVDEPLDEGDEFPQRFDSAIQNFLSLPDGWFSCLADHLWDYYQDILDTIGPEDLPSIKRDNIMDHIELGNEIAVLWDADEEDVYVSIESDCDWEFEHGLQITLKDGTQLAKVGPSDGHVTNADAYDQEEFEDVIYVKQDML